jgi:hypothetical protein
MIFISVTRLRVRSLRYLLQFIWYVLLTSRQVQRTPGFLGGKLIIDAKKTFWTMTAWQNEAVMHGYRDEGTHRRVMPKLRTWCDEAWLVHWNQESPDLPDLLEAYQRMAAEGRPSKVSHPSPAQVARQIAEPRLGNPERMLRPVQIR